MLEIIHGAKVKKYNELEEGYMIKDTCILANVHASKIEEIIADFLILHKQELVFLFLEVPTNQEEEKKLGGEKLHRDVFYLDALSYQSACTLFQEYKELWIHDGLIHFGFGNKKQEEIGKYKYNIIKIYQKNKKETKYEDLLKKQNIPKKEQIITAWDTFTEENPGTSHLYKDKKNRTVYDCVGELVQVELYKALVREE